MRRTVKRQTFGAAALTVLVGGAATVARALDDFSGPPADIAAVQRAAPVLESLKANLKDLPASPSQRLARVDAEAATLPGRVSSVWDAQVAAAALRDLRAELRLRADTPQVEQMLAATVAVTRWNAVHVHGARATAVFTADTRRQSATTGRWIDEGLSQFRVRLHRGPDARWRLVSDTSEALGGEG